MHVEHVGQGPQFLHGGQDAAALEAGLDGEQEGAGEAEVDQGADGGFDAAEQFPDAGVVLVKAGEADAEFDEHGGHDQEEEAAGDAQTDVGLLHVVGFGDGVAGDGPQVAGGAAQAPLGEAVVDPLDEQLDRHQDPLGAEFDLDRGAGHRVRIPAEGGGEGLGGGSCGP